MSELAETVRVVPSGKIYRQIFDAQVQLVDALESTSKARHKKSVDPLVMSHGYNVTSDASKPVVREPRTVTEGTGILTQRQRTWVTSFPNEHAVENPVLYKQLTDYNAKVASEPEASVAGREVRGLPDVVVPAKIGSDVIERIAESRRERHESALEDMHQELGIISSEIEPRIAEAGQSVVDWLDENSKHINQLLSLIETDEGLLRYDLKELHELWARVQNEATPRRDWITDLDLTLSKAEDDRMDQIRDIFKEYAETLGKIAHLMTADLSRFMDREAQEINHTMLSNRRSYSDLYARLMTSDIDREKRQHTFWTKRVEDWKNLNVEHAVTKFGEYMESDVVVNPSGIEKVLQFMSAEQKSVNARRHDIIASLGEIKPPASTKSAVYQWNEQLQALSEQIDLLNQKYLEKLHGEYELVCRKCLEEVDYVKSSLIDSGACLESRAQDVIDRQCLSLVGERQRVYEQNLDAMDKAFEEQNSYLKGQLKSLFKYAQGAAHVWDIHEIGLAKQERSLQEQLETCRHTHDNQNQDREGNLDITMDRMRQESSEKALKECLQKALEMLDKIRHGYDDFHHQQLDIVQGYPQMVRDELGGYDQSVCLFFAVDRSHPDDPDRKESPSTLLVSPDKVVSPRPRSRGKKKKRSSTSRPGSTTSVDSSQSPLPMAVSEVLSTARGTMFYVLRVAGEHGVPEDRKTPEEGASTTFMTAVESHDDVTPPYVRDTDIQDSFLAEVKKLLRLNFLNHLEDWSDQAMDRAQAVVAAKCEELNSELDLRLHLHRPRPRRAELDVHNVRAAELVMHNERVSRHCKGINHVLTELKHHFSKQTQEHNKWADRFREDIEALEVVFINATKSAKLVALQNQLQVELDKYMMEIRASLRKFRQHLDDTLQTLRESNARFIKSFKVFSDGGNFCPEEIEVYQKKLEKISQKIDSAEGFIMTDLEGMESRRLDHATKVASEFEDRFKNHMFDLIFMEKIARWLTNTQVKIKAEVAESNTQAQKLGQHLNDLDRRIDACEKPNLDKEQVSPTQLNDSLKTFFDACHRRSQYLNCLKDPQERPVSAMQGPPAVAVARVGFAPEVTTPAPPIAVSRPGKQPIEDPSVGVIKNILKTQKSRMRFGLDAGLDGDPTVQPGKVTREDTQTDKLRSSLLRPVTQTPIHSVGDKMRQSRKGTATTTTSDQPKRTHSGTIRRTNTKVKFDKKFLVFGEKNEDGEEWHFLGKIKQILREALDGLLTNSEMYYRQKGNRQVTRPQALQDNFEECAIVVVQKLESYHKQADEYHNQCLQEFRGQLDQLEDHVAHIPQLVITEILKTQLTTSHNERRSLDNDFNNRLVEWDKVKYEHKNLLRPTLGHPHLVDEIRALCVREEERRQQYLQGVQRNTDSLQSTAVSHAQDFVKELASVSEKLLLEFDNLLTVDDVKKGRVAPTKYATSELIRRKNAGTALQDDETRPKLARGKSVWKGILGNEFVAKEKSDKAKLTASITTAKTTLGHKAAVKARDSAYQDYKKQFEKTLLSIEDQRQNQVKAEQHWTDSWTSSVQKVKELY